MDTHCLSGSRPSTAWSVEAAHCSGCVCVCNTRHVPALIALVGAGAASPGPPDITHTQGAGAGALEPAVSGLGRARVTTAPHVLKALGHTSAAELALPGGYHGDWVVCVTGVMCGEVAYSCTSMATWQSSGAGQDARASSRCMRCGTSVQAHLYRRMPLEKVRLLVGAAARELSMSAAGGHCSTLLQWLRAICRQHCGAAVVVAGWPEGPWL